MSEQIDTCSKKVRGMARRSLDLIETMTAIARVTQPIIGRGVGYHTARADAEWLSRNLGLPIRGAAA